MSDNTQQTDWKERDIGALWQRQGRNQKYLSGHVRFKTDDGNVVEQRVIVFTNKHKSADNHPDFRVYQADEPNGDYAAKEAGSSSILDEVECAEVPVAESDTDTVTDEVL